jgi:transposase
MELIPLPRGPRPRVVTADSRQIAELEWRAHRRVSSQRDVIRACIILALIEGVSPSAVARANEVDVKTVRLWRDRFLAEGLVGLEDRQRPGREPRIPAPVRYETISMACAKPAEFGVLYRDVWTCESLAQAVLDRHPELGTFDASTAWRYLHGAVIRPHHEDMWLHSPDPEFRAKATAICALYLQVPPGSIVLCVDEKTGMQALGRPFPVREAAPRRARRKDSNYIRHGTRTLIAAFNPHSGRVFARVGATRTADDLIVFMEALAVEYPTGDVHIVWDNLNTHKNGPKDRWIAFNERHGGRFHFHFTPVHASWVNQVEGWFAILQKRVLRYGVFDSVEELAQRVVGFIEHWNEHGRRHPFRWKFKGYPLEARETAA